MSQKNIRNSIWGSICCAMILLGFHQSLFAVQNVFITSLLRNGSLSWTNSPGTNAFVLQSTPSGTIPWSNAPSPLDLMISTNSQNTITVPTNTGTVFYRIAQGFGLQLLHGVWILAGSGTTNVGKAYFISDGAGLVTNFGIFNTANPPGTYSVSSNGAMTLNIIAGAPQPQTNLILGQFLPPNQISLPANSSVLVPVQKTSLCAGNWSGRLSETNDPNGLTNYTFTISVNTNGYATVSGNFSGSGWVFSLAASCSNSLRFSVMDSAGT
jgi:hypothetical protein